MYYLAKLLPKGWGLVHVDLSRGDQGQWAVSCHGLTEAERDAVGINMVPTYFLGEQT